MGTAVSAESSVRACLPCVAVTLHASQPRGCCTWLPSFAESRVSRCCGLPPIVCTTRSTRSGWAMRCGFQSIMLGTDSKQPRSWVHTCNTHGVHTEAVAAAVRVQCAPCYVLFGSSYARICHMLCKGLRRRLAAWALSCCSCPGT